jgi:hypothetical protein
MAKNEKVDVAFNLQHRKLAEDGKKNKKKLKKLLNFFW